MTPPEPRALRALVFDFDHTLADFGRWVDWQGARGEIMALYAAEGLDPETITRRNQAFGLFTALDEALAERRSRAHADQVHDGALAVLDRYEAAGAARTSWLPGVPAILDAAVTDGLGLAIVSANGERAIGAVLERLGVAARFATVIGRSRTWAPKPAPEMHREALQRLGCSAAAALGIGDSPNDMRAAVAADMLSIGVLGGEGSQERLFAAGASWVLADLTALPALLHLWRESV